MLNHIEAKAKVEQRKLRNKMYGDEWLNVLKNLEGDDEAIFEARQQRKNEYNQRLATLVALKKLRASEEPEKLEDIEENEIRKFSHARV